MFESSVNKTEKIKVVNLKAKDFQALTENNENAVLIDVRTLMEFESGHIPNSLHIDMMSPQFDAEVKKLDKSKEYFLYCRSGNRSYFAGNRMLEMGFENVSHLSPGIIGWNGEIE